MEDSQITQRFYKRLFYKTIVATIVGCALFVHHHFYPFIPSLYQAHGQLIWLALGITSCFIVFYCGSYIFYTAWTALKFNETNKNTLIALGTIVLLIYSMLRVIFPHEIAPLFLENYFVSAVLIIALVNIATLLEAKAKRTNKFLLQHLHNLLPQKVILVNEKKEKLISLKEVICGDVLKIKPGDVFAVDGVIVKGNTKVDQSKLNGDPIPVKKEIDDPVIAGTLNKTATVLYKATYTGSKTALAHIITMLTQSQVSETKNSRFMNIFTAIFIPVILLLAVLTMLIWYNFGPSPHYVHAMLRAVTMLVIVSPTALVLSIPIPILMGIGKAAEYGILIRNAKTIMKTAKIDTVIVDKSGIVTKGKPRLMSIHAYEQWDENTLLQYAASLENRYEHPIANAIVQAAYERNIEILAVNDCTVEPSYGVKGKINNESVNLGNCNCIQQLNIELNGLAETAQRLEQQGYSTLYLAVNDQAVGIFALQDDIRKDAREAFSRLTKLGVKNIMFTADNRISAETVARKVGIDKVFANITMKGKLNEIKKLKNQGEVVALVAEATSDALALAKADISIAVATNDHVLLETANINLLRHSLHGIADAIQIARATRNKTRQNIGISATYNLVALILAAGISYPVWHWLLEPTEAAILMTTCTLSMIWNANRLLHFKPFKSLRKGYKK